MPELEPLVSLDELKTTRLQARDKPVRILRYDRRADMLMLFVIQPQHGTVVHYVDGDIALLYEDETFEIVGLHIEGFEISFLKKNPALERIWRLVDSRVEINDFGDLAVLFETLKPRLIQEVIKATQKQLGPLGQELAVAIA